jgi:putative acetyltransferase
MSEPSVSITAGPFGSPDAQPLISALDAELGALYPPEQRFGPNARAEHFEPGSGTFLMARAAGRAVGCGGVRLLDATTAEVNRMYVEPAHRGTGLGRAVLSALETAAQQMGVRRLVLETGIHQDAAIAVYRRACFTQVDCWGEYATSPSSVCFEKNL